MYLHIAMFVLVAGLIWSLLANRWEPLIWAFVLAALLFWETATG